jgi:hypothetical protein
MMDNVHNLSSILNVQRFGSLVSFCHRVCVCAHSCAWMVGGDFSQFSQLDEASVDHWIVCSPVIKTGSL